MDNLIQIVSPIDILPIMESYYKLENNMQWVDHGEGRQSCLQYATEEDPWISASGNCATTTRLTSTGAGADQELIYSNVNPYFKNTIFEKLINQYKLKRARLIWLDPRSCYSMHSDSTPRLHIPLITNPQCFFVFKQGVVQHIPINFVYRAETTELHTFINCSDQPRLHLVGILEKS